MLAIKKKIQNKKTMKLMIVQIKPKVQHLKKSLKEKEKGKLET